MTSYMIGVILHLYFCLMEVVCSSVLGLIIASLSPNVTFVGALTGQKMGPEINIPSDSYQVHLGRMLLLECHVQGARPLNITWLKSGKRLRNNKNYRLEDKIPTERGIKTYQLWIKEMKLSDFGYYTCLAVNSFGTMEKNVTVERAIEPSGVEKDSQTNSAVLNSFSLFQLYTVILFYLYWSLYNLTE